MPRKALNSKKNHSTRICTVCLNEFPKTKEHFTTFVSKRDGLVFQTKCKTCDRLYVQERNSKPETYIKSLVKGIEKDKKRTTKGFDITPEFVLNLYQTQDKKCLITNLDMTTFKGKGLYFSNVSIDRKDPNLGYTKDNIQLVCFWANQAKGVLSMDEFKNMIFITNSNLNQ
jgi:hypothetical protein